MGRGWCEEEPWHKNNVLKIEQKEKGRQLFQTDVWGDGCAEFKGESSRRLKTNGLLSYSRFLHLNRLQHIFVILNYMLDLLKT